jgi:hypothetical protein
VDDFSGAGPAWPQLDLAACTLGTANGQYNIRMKIVGQYCVAAAPTGEMINGVYTVAAKNETPLEGSVYGLIFGANDPQGLNQFYVFWVDANAQAYAVQKQDNGTWSDLTVDNSDGDMWISSGNILPGASVNRLKVWRKGTEIRLSVNGVLLYQLFDNSFPDHGYTGVINWFAYGDAASANVSFDNFRIDRFTVVYRDDYSRPDSGWFVDTIDACQAAYADSRYRTATQPDNTCVFGAPVTGQFNGLFEVEARRGESFYQTAYGLIFGIEGNFDRFYAYLVIPDTQSYALARYDNGLWSALTENPLDGTAWLFSDRLNTGTGVNRLGVERDGPYINLYANDAWLVDVVDFFPLTGNGFGVINSSSQFDTATADFDSYTVTAWEPSEPLVRAAGPGQGASQSIPLPDFLKPPAEQ